MYSLVVENFNTSLSNEQTKHIMKKSKIQKILKIQLNKSDEMDIYIALYPTNVE